MFDILRSNNIYTLWSKIFLENSATQLFFSGLKLQLKKLRLKTIKIQRLIYKKDRALRALKNKKKLDKFYAAEKKLWPVHSTVH